MYAVILHATSAFCSGADRHARRRACRRVATSNRPRDEIQGQTFDTTRGERGAKRGIWCEDGGKHEAQRALASGAIRHEDVGKSGMDGRVRKLEAKMRTEPLCYAVPLSTLGEKEEGRRGQAGRGGQSRTRTMSQIFTTKGTCIRVCNTAM